MREQGRRASPCITLYYVIPFLRINFLSLSLSLFARTVMYIAYIYNCRIALYDCSFETKRGVTFLLNTHNIITYTYMSVSNDFKQWRKLLDRLLLLDLSHTVTSHVFSYIYLLLQLTLYHLVLPFFSVIPNVCKCNNRTV